MFKHPWLIVAVISAITVFFALQLPRVDLDNNNLRFVPAEDEARVTSAYIDETFGSTLFILIGLERKYGGIFDPVFLNRLREYVNRIGEIEITGDITSIVNADYITGDGESIIVEPLVADDFSGSPEEIDELKRRLLSWDLYERSLFSDDFSATQILVPLTAAAEDGGGPEVTGSFFQIRDLAQEMFDGLAEVYVTGIPVMTATISEAMKADLLLLIPLVTIVVVIVIFIPFRRVTATALSLLAVLVAVIWSIGAMPLLGVKLSVLSTVLPVILIAVGSSYGIHIVIHYIEERGLRAESISDAEHRELVSFLTRHTAKPIFLAALTTFVGFLSLCFTQVVPIREFGIFASFGVMISFIITVTLIPAILLIRGQRPMRELWTDRAAAEGSGTRDRIAAFFAALAGRKYAVLAVSAALVLAAVYSASKVIIDNIMVEYFKSDTDIYRSDRFIRERFGGSKIVSVVLEAERPEIVLHPDSLKAMDGLNRYLEERVEEVGKTMGFTDLIKRINQVFNAGERPEGLRPQAAFSGDDASFGFGFDESTADSFGFGFEEFDEAQASAPAPIAESGAGNNDRTYTGLELAGLLDRAAGSASERSLGAAALVREFQRLVNYEGAAYYEIPHSPERYGKSGPEGLNQLVSNYLVLLSGNITSYANDPLEPTAIKTTIQLRTVGQRDTSRAVERIQGYVRENFPDNVKVTIGGSALVENSINRLVVESQLISIGISIIALFLIVSCSYRSIAAGVICIIPLSILILFNFAVMGLTGIKLNLGTAMIASVALGVGIDYTIHFVETYRREYQRSGGQGEYLKRTYLVSGIAIIVDALSVGLGFAVLLFSHFNMLIQFGLLVAAAMIFGALLGLIIIPALLAVFKPKFIARSDK
ncbi:MAG: MMPL family transporter [Treponema sp.]|jgi:predicted RND superfamily exporter protein|nr:MMPL family transporter [Treponema sp.]